MPDHALDTFIPLSVPHIRGNEWQYVKECLDTEWVSTVGSFVMRFEEEFAALVGAKHAVACASGSAALHIALLLVGVKPGELVLAPTLTFIASVNAIRYCGAFPIFFDADDYYNIDVEQVLNFLHEDCNQSGEDLIHRKSGRRIAAALPVHVFGNAAALQPLIDVCKTLRLPIVEDAAESIGTRYHEHAGPNVREAHRDHRHHRLLLLQRQ